MRQARHCALLCAVLCFTASFSQAKTKSQRETISATENRANSLYQQGKYSEAFALYRRGAELGSVVSQAFVGFMVGRKILLSPRPDQHAYGHQRVGTVVQSE